MNASVLLLIFNRPELTEKIFNRIAKAKPEKLFLVADGPREDNAEDEKACAEVKRIVENVTWECEVYRNYSEKNLGCGIRVASGISWVFDHVDRAIILEDDCLPDSTFFPFCVELLEKYRDDKRIMTVSGRNLYENQISTEHSYYFSTYPGTWGWATWRRAWKYYDYHVRHWQKLKKSDFPLGITHYDNTAKYMRHHFEKAYRNDPPENYRLWGNSYTWDYQWVFTCWVQHGISVIPDRNLVSNIGFGEKATHTKNELHEFASLPVTPIEFPLKHPSHKLIHKKADDYHFKKISEKLTDLDKKRPNYFLKVKNKLIQKMRDLKFVIDLPSL